MQQKESRRWRWERHGGGWALYQGNAMDMDGHKIASLWVADTDFDETGQKLREKIATLLNGDEGL